MFGQNTKKLKILKLSRDFRYLQKLGLKLSITFLSLCTLLNMNDTFTAIFAILAYCDNLSMQLIVAIFCEKIQLVEVLLSSLGLGSVQLRDEFLCEMFAAFCVLVHVIRISHK